MRPMPTTQVERLLSALKDWSGRSTGVQGLALVGSWAGDRTHAECDIDVVCVVDDPEHIVALVVVEHVGITVQHAVADFVVCRLNLCEVPDLGAAEVSRIAEAIGVGAVKYADLCQSRTTDYIFDVEKMTATSGNTATYMQYAYARCRAIFRKGDVDEARFRTSPPAVRVTHPAERALALQLLRFPEAVESAAADYAPHHITGYLWDLAKSYSVFFEGCPVLRAETPELRDSRLLLVDLVSRVIKQALELLGIGTVERM